MSAIVWFRDDLRLADNAALTAAVAFSAASLAQNTLSAVQHSAVQHSTVQHSLGSYDEAAESPTVPSGIIACYIHDEVTTGTRPLGSATKWWLHESLLSLSQQLAEHGIPLILRSGSAINVIPDLVAESGASAVFWNRRYGVERHADALIKTQLKATGIHAESCPGGLLFEPWRVATQTGTPYRVYSAFWRACLAAPQPELPLPVPAVMLPAQVQPTSEHLADWHLQPTTPSWAAEFSDFWQPGEQAARERLDVFLETQTHDYQRGRDYPAIDACSRLSPHLRWGEISPRTIWHQSVTAANSSHAEVGSFLSEIGWREFAWHTLFHQTTAVSAGDNPGLHVAELNKKFAAFPWLQPDPAEFSAWKMGETGFGIVDAGMRELWRTGFMHNRVRMVVASLLTKNLLTDWRAGEAWFWDTLLDADAASNPFNWQWVAGCGADAAPYFRIFNPETQQKKFDPEGSYTAKWAPDSLTFPPLVDLTASRRRALDAYQQIK